MIPIDYKMQNNINGVDYSIVGDGAISDGGIKSITAEISAIPKEWSGVLIPCICSGPGETEEEISSPSEKCLLAFAPKGYATEKGTLRRATLWDQTGDVIARVTATGVYRRLSKGMDYDIRVQTSTKPNSIASRLANVDHYGFVIIPNGAGRAKVVTHYSLSTKQGETARGTTVIHYQFIGSRSVVPELIVGHNTVKVQQIGRSIQWIVKQNTELSSSLGIKDATITPLG